MHFSNRLLNWLLCRYFGWYPDCSCVFFASCERFDVLADDQQFSDIRASVLGHVAVADSRGPHVC